MKCTNKTKGNDAKLKRLVVDWLTQHALQQAFTNDDDEYDLSWDEQDRLEQAIAKTPADSLDGVLFKLRWLVEREKASADEASEPVKVLGSTLTDLERLRT